MDKKILILSFILSILAFICSTSLTFAANTSGLIEEYEKQEKRINIDDILKKPDVSYDAIDARDPFLELIKKESPVETTEEGLPEDLSAQFSIQGIIWGSSIPQAIINSKVVKVGDTIDGARIIEISKTGIVVFYNNRRYTLASPGSSGVIKPPESK